MQLDSLVSPMIYPFQAKRVVLGLEFCYGAILLFRKHHISFSVNNKVVSF